VADIFMMDKGLESDASGELFVKLFEFNPAALAISRIADSVIIHVNESFLRLFEFSSKDEVIGRTAADLQLMVNPVDRAAIIEAFKRGDKVVNSESNIRTHKNNLKWITSSILPISINGQPSIMAVLIEITGRKLAEDQLKQINSELEKTVAERTKQAIASEYEYKELVQQATDGILISDSNGKYIDVNPAACKMTGYSRGEFLSLKPNQIVSEEELIRNPSKLPELNAGKIMLITRDFIRKDGSILPVEINARMMTSGRIVAIIRDITERKKAEERSLKMNESLELKVAERTSELERKITQLRESEEKFERAFQASAAGISIIRLSDAVYFDVNDAFIKITGYSKEELINHTSKEINLVVDIDQREEVLKQIRSDGSVQLQEMRLRTKEGKFKDILCSSERVVIGGEQFAINITYDITQRKLAEAQLEATNKELEAFSYSISHDLRAPLRSILGYTQLIEEDFSGQLTGPIKTNLEIVKKNAAKMGRLIDDLLEFSRLGRAEITRSPIDTLALVKAVIVEFAEAGKPTESIVVKPLETCFGDLAMMKQIWMNLISNALKYSGKKLNPKIEIGSDRMESEVIYYVRDNGAGFRMDYAHKLFGVFQRLHREADFEGTGVGLALVKRIINKHDGRVWAEGRENEGATFYFSLPLKKD
jgi:PAS domain S-box-containing protein